MAKKRTITGQVFNLTEKGVELKFKAGFSLKLDNTDVGQEHVANFDLSMTKDDAIDLMVSTLVIDAQKIMRASGSHAKAREFTKDVISWKRLYPGTRTVIKKEMTLAEIAEKAKTDPAYRAELLKQLGVAA
jgi:hypothetical protein